MEKSHTPKLRTPQQVREDFDRRGLSFSEWARVHKVSRALVWKVLAGRSKNKRGESHRIAVLLGIKAGSAPAANAPQRAQRGGR